MDLLQYLCQIQHQLNCIPAAAISQLAGALQISAAEVRGVIEFYAFLHEQPRGQYDILFSDNITDQMLGS
ncbi:MAG: NAD(P)H-dependent oxidoreductase subunit E, partial [Gammaproteobacteria bacterium]|nr:NAD(P)H-dependent oxidoreductase subunit E [Gammaproteobacteria bacterium]